MRSLLCRIFLFLALFASVRAQTPWQWSVPKPQGGEILGLAEGLDGTLLMTGRYGAVWAKPPGSPWVQRPTAASGGDLGVCLFWGGRFFTLADGKVLASTNAGQSWQELSGPTRAYGLTKTADGVVALETDSVWLVTSPGAIALTEVPLPEAAGVPYQVAFGVGNRVYVGGRSGVILSSTQPASSWTPANLGAGITVFGIAGSTDHVVAIAASSGPGGSFVSRVFRSTDAQTWQPVTLPATAAGFLRIFFGSGRFLAEDINGFFESNDGGATWQLATSVPAGFFPTVALPTGTDTLFAGNRGSIYRRSSAGGWTPEFEIGVPGFSLWPPLFSATRLGSVIVAKDGIGTGSEILRSTDAGLTWTNVPALTRFERALSGLTAIGGEVVGHSTGDGSVSPPRLPGFYGSSNGLTWTLKNEFPFPGSVFSLAANEATETWVAVTRELVVSPTLAQSYRRSVYYRVAGGNWTKVPLAVLDRPNPVEPSVERVFWDGNKFVLLLYPGRVFLSVNGVQWQALPLLPSDQRGAPASYRPSGAPAANVAVSVASDGTRLLARSAKLDANGLIGPWFNGFERFFQFVGGAWVECPVPVERLAEDGGWPTVDWIAGRFYAPVPGSVLSSVDGVQWSSQFSGSSVKSLLQAGDRLTGFTDEMAVMTRLLTETSGSTLPFTTVSPRNVILPPEGSTASIAITSTVPEGWAASTTARWLTFSPVSGNGDGELSITAAPHRGASARSAMVRVGSDSVLVTQRGTAVTPVLTVGSRGGRINIPLTGPWRGQSGSPHVGFLTAGIPVFEGLSGASVTVAANSTAEDRRMSVLVNGIEYQIVQFANLVRKPLSFFGPVFVPKLGPIPPAFDPDSVESLRGTLQMTVNPPTAAAPYGAFSASLTVFDGAATTTFRGSGPINSDGQIAAILKGGRTAVLSLELTGTAGTGAMPKDFSGTVTVGTQTLRVYSAVTAGSVNQPPLQPNLVGRYNLVLRENSSLTFGTGFSSLAVDSKGLAKGAGRTGDGTTWSFSSPFWSTQVGSNALTVFSPLFRGAGMIGTVLGQDPDDGTWMGSAKWVGPSPINESPLDAFMSRYASTPLVPVPLNWPNGGIYEVIPADVIYDFSGTVAVSVNGALTVSMNNPGIITKARLTVSTGVIQGTMSFLPTTAGEITTKVTASFHGVINAAENRVEGFCLLPGGSGFNVPSALFEITPAGN